MTIQLSPEQERAIQEAIKSGFVRSVDEFIAAAIAMLPHPKDQRESSGDELLMETRKFFASRSLSELTKAQGVMPLDDPSILIGGWPADENLDEFLEKTYRERSA
ncbi:MAG TPA: hypothetical protein VKY85_18235 [Candidatus Angelobacter sp.]|nr:hypothetical protein [Candidatus Angelobacter sp.]